MGGDFAKAFEDGLMTEMNTIKGADGESCMGKVFGKGSVEFHRD